MPQIKKRAPTAYNFLTKDKELREQIKREHPDWKNGDILSEYSRLWKSWGPDEKKKYQDLADQAKKEFQEASGSSSSSDSEGETTTRHKKAMTAFFHYLHDPDVKSKAKQENPDLKLTELTKVISSQWKTLSSQDKEPWEEKSKQQALELENNPIIVTKKTRSSKTKKPTSRVDGDDRILALEKKNLELMNKVEELANKVEQLIDSKQEPEEQEDYFSDDDE